MAPLLPIAALTLAAIITPGPNNVIVMSRAARSGLSATLPAIIAIVAGGAALVFVSQLALREHSLEFIAKTVEIVGPLLLMFMATNAWRHAGAAANAPVIRSVFGLALFQVANPKAWVLAATAASAANAQRIGPAQLLPLFAAISLLGLLIWSMAGAALTLWLSSPERLLAFERSMAALLFFSALLLLINACLHFSG